VGLAAAMHSILACTNRVWFKTLYKIPVIGRI